MELQVENPYVPLTKLVIERWEASFHWSLSEWHICWTSFHCSPTSGLCTLIEQSKASLVWLQALVRGLFCNCLDDEKVSASLRKIFYPAFAQLGGNPASRPNRCMAQFFMICFWRIDVLSADLHSWINVIQLVLQDHPEHGSPLCLLILERKAMVRSDVLTVLPVILQTKGWFSPDACP